ncbi:MAG: hypothetical protein LBV51_04075 [Acholeplasmatales bacterium]|jgi:hypothetical protein|nr:hypothetical protein [Acholeplasmatales bacterium]
MLGDKMFLKVISVGEWFSDIYQKVNSWFKGLIPFDEFFRNLYDKYISPVPEIFKYLGALLLVLIIIFGVFGLIKKFFKFFLIIAIILIVVFIITNIVK